MRESSGQNIVLGDETIETTSETVDTVDEFVVSTDEVVQEVVTPELASEVLLGALGPIVDADYVPGKTCFRDVLCDRFELSEIEAEELVDSLEVAGHVRFISSEEGFGWSITRAGSGA
ncbi:hypothetical protein [Chondromyces crocatus]|uniref:Uncharacterized protein n=1 Tax=Chondromyces crocatus TaxID=52 RepID=A0A0K1ET63_CHOCO|nr:hypothetical protein [Chondromyces crocatus]AKT43837.1 uncharacterized protein CMC5_080740 [Chondromyces crocatus]